MLKINEIINEEEIEDFLNDIQDEVNYEVNKIRRDKLYNFFGDLEEGIVKEIVDNTIIQNMDGCDDYSEKFFNTEVKDAIDRFIICEDESEEDLKCKERVKSADLMYCVFENSHISNKSLYYII